jgi:outer membrane lipoprotein-sorting protein
VSLTAAFHPASAAQRSLGEVLRQIDAATRDLRGLTAEAQITDVRPGAESATRGATVYVDTGGSLRVELPGEEPKTLLCTPSELHEYRPKATIVEEFKRQEHPEKLAQYALLGFNPSGTALERSYLVSLLEETMLEDRKVLLLELTPKLDLTRSSVSRIHLWIDEANWLPIQQKVFHTSADTHLLVRYKNVARNDSLDPKLFDAKWPKGTTKIKK